MARPYPVLLAVLGAVLFGASAPLSKVLLGEVDPVLLAGLLYLGCGIGLLIFKLLLRASGAAGGVPLDRKDVPWLAGAVLAGGVAAPIALMLGLRSTPAATASLLLNFECVATTILAAFLFQEYIGKRIWLAVGLITLASAVLSFSGSQFGLSPGALAIILACVLWGVDNNLTRNISSKDPLSIGIVKGLVAGTFSLLLALALGARLPGLQAFAAAMLLGSLSYGLSIALFIMAMRSIGAARTSAWMGTAPFAGVVISFIIFRATPSTTFLIALPLMALGALLLFGEEHAHTHIHVHGTITHEHMHAHDDHDHGHEH
ncbi:MAG TPA: DMT family transporter [Methanocella sp.]|uniref:DMT family transporter n=1 Tax=Methanocella sp. TaxID=2052833 RepID=UPI002C5A1FA7|nr:DMT family transporter [Methanocella sp.]HTY91820.1 DMT family transporter [Methanocella sp.]